MSRTSHPFNTKPLLLLTVSLIGACSSVGELAKSSFDSASSYYGTDSFTLIATSPANFGLISNAQYSSKSGQDCRAYSSGLGAEVSGRHQKTDEIYVKNVAQTASFTIPLTYHIAGCQMELRRVDIAVDGRYGPTSLDIGGDVGGISVIEDSAIRKQSESPSANFYFRGVCTWMFQLSTARIQKDGISKILSCSAAKPDWSVPSDYLERSKPGGKIEHSALKNSTINIIFRVALEEEPSMDNRWNKTEKGWKPCQGTEHSNRCQTPPSFKTFTMSGRQCTVYPACTE